MPHSLTLRVYYEDTDAAGIVYYANYLKYIERARTEWIRALGVDQVALRRDQGIVFVVRHLTADYLAPARFDDMLTVTTTLLEATGARIRLTQQVSRGETQVFDAIVTLACLTDVGTPARLPQALRTILRS